MIFVFLSDLQRVEQTKGSGFQWGTTRAGRAEKRHESRLPSCVARPERIALFLACLLLRVPPQSGVERVITILPAPGEERAKMRIMNPISITGTIRYVYVRGICTS